MKLFLASRVSNTASIESFKKFINGFENKTIAYIPTADNAEEGWEVWKNGGTWKMVGELGAKVNLVQLEDFRNDSVLKEIEGKDILWLAGGMPGYLMYWIRRCGIDKEIKNILNNGTVLVGSSAGAMVTGQSLQIAEFGFTDSETGAKDIKPMELVDFDIFPHYQDEFFGEIKKNYTGRKIYLLKDGEQIIVDGDKIEVQGEEKVVTNT